MLQRVSLSTRAHERNAGDTDDRLAHWMNRVKFSAARGDSSLFKSHMRSIVRDFSAIRQAHAPLPHVASWAKSCSSTIPTPTIKSSATLWKKAASPS